MSTTDAFAQLYCGDSLCNNGETRCTCPTDCLIDASGDGCCTGAEDAVNTPGDCAVCSTLCPNTICDPGETVINCPVDCSPVCSNSIREGTEVCDGTDLNGQNCVSQGFSGGGTLACNAGCTAFDTTNCALTSICSNNNQEGSEVCDGTDLNSQTCVTQGFLGGGTLACNATCNAFVTTGCNCSAEPVCAGATASGSGTISGTSITYNCSTGYTGTEAVRTCGSSDWSGSCPTCTVVDCGAPPSCPNATPSAGGTTYGSSRTYSCDAGFSGSDTIRNCLSGGTWDGFCPTCASVACTGAVVENPTSGGYPISNVATKQTAPASYLTPAVTRTNYAAHQWCFEKGCGRAYGVTTAAGTGVDKRYYFHSINWQNYTDNNNMITGLQCNPALGSCSGGNVTTGSSTCTNYTKYVPAGGQAWNVLSACSTLSMPTCQRRCTGAYSYFPAQDRCYVPKSCTGTGGAGIEFRCSGAYITAENGHPTWATCKAWCETFYNAACCYHYGATGLNQCLVFSTTGFTTGGCDTCITGHLCI